MSGRRMKRGQPDASPPADDEDVAEQEDLALPIGSGWRRLRRPAVDPEQVEAGDRSDGAAGDDDEVAGGGRPPS